MPSAVWDQSGAFCCGAAQKQPLTVSCSEETGATRFHFLSDEMETLPADLGGR